MLMEMLQLMPGIYGTFDAIDIVVEVSTSILVIKILNAKERGYEKE